MNRFDRRPLLWSIAMASLWAILAALRPTTTFHLAPALIPLAAGFALWEGYSTRSEAQRDVLVAGSIAVATSFGLAAVGNLEGPSLLPLGGALLESLVVGAFGIASALVIATRKGRSTARPTS